MKNAPDPGALWRPDQHSASPLNRGVDAVALRVAGGDHYRTVGSFVDHGIDALLDQRAPVVRPSVGAQARIHHALPVACAVEDEPNRLQHLHPVSERVLQRVGSLSGDVVGRCLDEDQVGFRRYADQTASAPVPGPDVHDMRAMRTRSKCVSA